MNNVQNKLETMFINTAIQFLNRGRQYQGKDTLRLLNQLRQNASRLDREGGEGRCTRTR